jgi:hypothetical protein
VAGRRSARLPAIGASNRLPHRGSGAGRRAAFPTIGM